MTADQHPDHDTIADFRKTHLKALASFFVDVLQLCQEAGLVTLGHICLDGTKVKANASKHKAMSYGRMDKTIQQLEAEVKQLLEEAQTVDENEDARYGKGKRIEELPQELQRRQDRIAKIKEAKQALEAEAKARAEAQRQAIQENVTQESNDKKQLKPLVEDVKTTAGEKPDKVSCDSGYYSDDNVAYLESEDIDGYIATARQKHSEKVQPTPRGRIPQDATSKERMGRKVRTKKGRETYSKRKQIVEPVFGQTKEARGFRRFSLRGLENVTCEWDMICLTHNILKLFRSGFQVQWA